MAEPQPISWARLRRQIMDDVRRIKSLLSQHQKEGLPAADLQVIKRGKALEYFSRHYGKVFIEKGREFTIREALVGINQLLDDDTGTAGGPEAPPSNAEPYTRQFFRLFYETTQVPRDQMSKFLRGTGIAPSDFEERGWCSEKNKIFTFTPPIELARAWKGASAQRHGAGLRPDDVPRRRMRRGQQHPRDGHLGQPELRAAPRHSRTRGLVDSSRRLARDQIRRSTRPDDLSGLAGEEQSQGARANAAF